MKKAYLIFLVIVFIEIMVGTLVGPDKGTMDSFMYWPIIVTVVGGLLVFGINMIRKKK